MTGWRVSIRVVNGTADCQSCSWATSGRNAGGNAAQHAQKTGHDVTVETVLVAGPRAGEREREADRRALQEGKRLL